MQPSLTTQIQADLLDKNSNAYGTKRTYGNISAPASTRVLVLQHQTSIRSSSAMTLRDLQACQLRHSTPDKYVQPQPPLLCHPLRLQHHLRSALTSIGPFLLRLTSSLMQWCYSMVATRTREPGFQSTTSLLSSSIVRILLIRCEDGLHYFSSL